MPEPPPPPPSLPPKELPINRYKFIWRVLMISNLALGGSVDGARLGSNWVIGSGGLIRDWHGNWIAGLIAKKGVGEVLHAELWALFYGLKMAKARNFSLLIVEADSALVVSLIHGSPSLNQPLYGLVLECRNLIIENWSCNVQHVHRVCNFAADRLSKLGLNSETVSRACGASPCLVKTLSDDCSRVAIARLVFP